MANIYIKMANAYFKSSDYQAALGFYKDALRQLQKHYEESPNRVEIAEVFVLKADTYMKLEEYQQAAEFYSQALNIHRNIMLSATTITTGTLSSTSSMSSALLSSLTTTTDQETSSNQQLSLGGGQQVPVSPDTASIYNKLGNAYFGQRDYLLAIKSYRDALNARKSLGMPDDMTTVKLYYNVGFVYLNLKEAKKANEYFNRALDLIGIVLGAGDYVEKADCYLRIGDSFIIVIIFFGFEILSGILLIIICFYIQDVQVRECA